MKSLISDLDRCLCFDPSFHWRVLLRPGKQMTTRSRLFLIELRVVKVALNVATTSLREPSSYSPKKSKRMRYLRPG
ncbi:MAG: hypothetical protein R3260_10420 [Pseudomonas sp.]|nr:hypothetical protein [Pseudomonas sp.]